MPAPEPVLSFLFPALLDALTEHFFDEFEHRARTPAVANAPCLLRLADATFDPTTFTGAVLPPHAEPPLVIDDDVEGW